jgi:hypothetical protein
VTLSSGNFWNAWWDWCHVRSPSWCHISTLVLFSSSLFINSEELIYFQISRVPYLNSQTQFIITFTIEVGIKFMFIVIFGLTFEWGMLFRSKIQLFYRDFTRQTIKLFRLKCVLAISSVKVMIRHFNRINLGGSATTGIRAETYTPEVRWTLKLLLK